MKSVLIGERRKAMATLFKPAMQSLSKKCVSVWSNSEQLDKVLQQNFYSLPNCHLVYAVNKSGKQKSSNITKNGIDSSCREQDLSVRPYSINLHPNFTLSSTYISQATGTPCISAVHPIVGDEHLGFTIADFDIRYLPLPTVSINKTPVCNKSCHPTNHLENRLIDVKDILLKLISKHGVFHLMIHYLSSKVMLWQMADPYKYKLYSIEQVLEPDMHLTYPQCPFPTQSKVSIEEVQLVLERFHILQLVNDEIYLRSASINIMNAMVSLSFSFSGSKYIPVADFLRGELSDWFK
ncbi:PDC sensor domain-containing protein [Candidatus Halobeggiatoa sp. HSG11]|nr:PDC sensor domain-containing protein [Candidatus Halobeggiatoa sp. HSG11]